MEDNSGRKRGRGRPLKADARRKQLHMLLDDSEDDMLKHLTIETDMCRSEIIRKALTIYYNMKIGRM